jgi:hypothetical protein
MVFGQLDSGRGESRESAKPDRKAVVKVAIYVANIS